MALRCISTNSKSALKFRALLRHESLQKRFSRGCLVRSNSESHHSHRATSWTPRHDWSKIGRFGPCRFALHARISAAWKTRYSGVPRFIPDLVRFKVFGKSLGPAPVVLRIVNQILETPRNTVRMRVERTPESIHRFLVLNSEKHLCPSQIRHGKPFHQ